MTAFVLLSRVARAEEEVAADLEPERDRLIEQIVRGVDREAKSRRFAELWRTRQQRLADRDRQHKESKAWRESFDKSTDGLVHDRCLLAPDPAKPPATKETLPLADWGRVTAKRARKSENVLKPDETLYDVAGVAKTYSLSGTGDSHWPALEAAVGDWVLVCAGHGLRIFGPPRITRKKSFDPLFMPPSSFDWAIAKNDWYYPNGTRVLTYVMIEKDLGDDRLQVKTPAYKSWVLQASPALPNRALLKPGRGAWVIAGGARLDPQLGQLVLKAEDVEESYFP